MAPTKAPAVKLKYTNRKSESLKLASIVAKDLRKHTTSFSKKKEVTENDSAPLELDLEHKDQNDACVDVFVHALHNTLQARDGITPLRLEELNLSHNNLTATSLGLLAPVIESACFDLHDVDVSYNQIRVTTRQEAQAFECFLQAFRRCELMRRLDLSGNDFSGPLAMEVFLRVYSRQPPVDPSLLQNEFAAEPVDAEADMLSERTNDLKLSPNGSKYDYLQEAGHRRQSLDSGKYIYRRRGLRAIPYILLRDAKLDDAGALHLSYVLEQHYWPQYLMTKLKEGSREAKRKDEDDVGGCYGMLYTGNNALSPTGRKVLEYANAARAELVGARIPSRTPQSSWVDAANVATPSTIRSRKLSSHSDESDRRASGPITTIDSLRKRLQRTTIETHGVQGVQLWHSAFKILYAARVILPSDSALRSDGNRRNYVSRLEALAPVPGEPLLAVTEESSFPIMPVLTDDLARRATKPSADRHSLLQTKPNGTHAHVKLPVPIVIDKNFERDDCNPRGLPTWLWKRIMVEYAGAEGVLNTEQIERAFVYASNRSDIADEQHHQAKGESHQLWHVLEEFDCFTYKMETASG